MCVKILFELRLTKITGHPEIWYSMSERLARLKTCQELKTIVNNIMDHVLTFRSQRIKLNYQLEIEPIHGLDAAFYLLTSGLRQAF
jgi:hypothetical protein